MREFKGNSILNFTDSYTVIDVETTGLDPSHDSIIEVAALRVCCGNIVDSYSSLINPGFLIDSFISDLTGITNEQLSSAPSPCDVFPILFDFIGDSILVGHNVHFDINFLYDNFQKYTGKFLSNNFIDTLKLSKKYINNVSSHSLNALADHLNISVERSHRAFDDCVVTNMLYKKLIDYSKNPLAEESKLLNSLTFDETNPFYGKRIVVKGLPQLYTFSFMQAVAEKCGAKLSDVFYNSCDYIVFSKFTYNKYKNGDFSQKFEKANRLVEAGTLTILSETEWCNMLNIPVPTSAFPPSNSRISAKDIVSNKNLFDETHPLYGKICVFTGTLEKMVRKDAMQIVVDYGGMIADSVTKKTNYLILGNSDYCSSIKDGKSSKQKKAEKLKLSGQDIEIISETVFYDMISEM